MIVPQDICDYIVDIIAADTQTTQPWYRATPRWQLDAFSVCSLLCRNWLPRSSYHLFKKVVVFDEERFLRVVHESPRVALNVKILAFSYRTVGRNADRNLIDAIISRLPNLRSLSIDVEDSTNPPIFRSIVSRRELHRLRLDSMTVTSVLHHLYRFQSIDELVLRNIKQGGIDSHLDPQFKSLVVKDLMLISSMSASPTQLLDTLKTVVHPESIQRLALAGNLSSGYRLSMQYLGQSAISLALNLDDLVSAESTPYLLDPFQFSD